MINLAEMAGVVSLAVGLSGLAAAAGLWMMFAGAVRTPKTCHHCGARLPIVHMPQLSEQVLRGGWICQKCGTQFDSRGKACNQIA